MDFGMFVLIVVILGLITFILLRDEGARNFVKRIFSVVGSKIRDVRIKGQINKETEKKKQLLIQLGERSFKENVNIEGADVQVKELLRLQSESNAIQEKLDKILGQTNYIRKAYNNFKTKQDQLIREQEDFREAPKNDLDQLEKDYSDFEKKIRSRENIISKNEKNIAGSKQKIESIEEDRDFSTKEKISKIEEIKPRIGEWEVQINTARQEIQTIRDRIPGLEEKINKLRGVVVQFDEKIGTLKTEDDNEKRNHDVRMDELEKEKRALNVEKVGIAKQMDLHYEKLGKDTFRWRPGHPKLNELYNQLEAINKNIQDLESQLSKKESK